MIRRCTFSAVFAFVAALAIGAYVLPAQAQTVTKTISLGTGVNGTYWRIFWVTVNTDTNVISFVTEGYLDKPTWQAGSGPVAQRAYTMPVPAGAATMTWPQLVGAMRDFVLTQSEFSGGAATN